MAPGFEKPSLTPMQPAPKPARNVVELRPVSTISVAAPHQESRQPLTAIPQPELIPMEYHAERLRGTPVCLPEWQTARLAPAPPRFVVGIAYRNEANSTATENFIAAAKRGKSAQDRFQMHQGIFVV